MTREIIRVGFLLATDRVTAWQHLLIENVTKLNCVTVELVIQTDSGHASDMNGNKTGSLYRQFRKQEQKCKAPQPDACEIKDPLDLLNEFETIILPAENSPETSAKMVSAIRKIRNHNLDVIVSLNPDFPIDKLVAASTYGVWYYQHGPGQPSGAREASLGFWEVIKRRGFVTSALLIRTTGDDGNYVGYLSRSGVDRQSHSRTRKEHLWKIFHFVPRALQKLHADGGDKYFQTLDREAGIPEWHRSKAWPDLKNSNLLFPLIMYCFWRLKQKFARKLGVERWILMFKKGRSLENLSTFKPLEPPSGKFWADPCIIRRNDQYCVFIEEADIATGFGHLSVIQLNSDCEFSSITPIIKRPYHLSYPFVFEWKDDLYLIPESGDNRTIQLYRCTSFPFAWEFEKNLMQNVSAFDSTIFEHDGCWWMFTNIQGHEGASSWDELCLFFADNPLSTDWKPHPMNPIVSDVRFARPAGKLFKKSGKIYRPSQNSSYRYGYGLNICEVNTLSKTVYAESVKQTFEPGWNRSVKALHTYSNVDELTFIDAICRTRN